MIVHLTDKQLEQLQTIVANYDKTPGTLLTGEQLRLLDFALNIKGLHEYENKNCPRCEGE
jgi:hypothetical protein